MGCHFLLQGIFLTQGSNLGLPHCRQILYCLSHQGSPYTYGLVHIDVCRRHPGREPSLEPDPVLDFQPPELREGLCCCSSVSPGDLSGQPIPRQAPPAEGRCLSLSEKSTACRPPRRGTRLSGRCRRGGESLCCTDGVHTAASSPRCNWRTGMHRLV